MSQQTDLFAPAPRQWSDYQKAVFDDFERDAGNTVIDAVAGSGKSTTITEGGKYIPRGRRAAFCAFNSDTAKELEKKVPRGVEAKTIHSISLRTLGREFGQIVVDKDKGEEIARKVLVEYRRVDSKGEPWGNEIQKVKKLASLAKNTLAEETAEAMVDLASEFDIFEDELKFPMARLAECGLRALDYASAEPNRVDFDDMIWLTAKNDIRPRTYDVLLVDETQDLNKLQLWFVRSAIRAGGRIVAVGDPHQAIYAWRGADSEAMPRMIRELNAKVLPLSVCYRCPKSVIQLAKTIVPQIEAAPGAEEGLVRSCSMDELRRVAQPGQLILSRINAPLMSLCLGFLRQNRRARMAGREIGKTLTSLIDRSKARTVPDLASWLRHYQAAEVERLTKLGKERKIEEVFDRVACLNALSEGETLVSAVREKLDSLFADTSKESTIVCSSVHKAKGDEREVVYMLDDTFRRKNEKNPAEAQNIFYVAVTRAKRELVRVTGN